MEIKINNQIEEIYGRDLLSLSIQERENYINDALIYWRKKGFPYPELSTLQIEKEFLKIKGTPSSKIFDKEFINYSTTGIGLANSFMHQMWHIPCQGHTKAPINHFLDDDTLKKLLGRAISFWPNRKCWRAYNIRNLLRIYSGGRVSNFRPTVSKALIEKFSSNNESILDFCAGFGGRLLGAMTLKRHYVGIDAARSQVDGLQRLYNQIKPFSDGSSELYCQSAEDLLPEMESNSFNLVFTSPPYYNLEKYSTNKDQSYLRYNNYDEWKSEFLHKTIIESKRLLKQKGILILNVSNIPNYSISNDVESFGILHYKLLKTYYLSMNTRPVQRSNGSKYRYEPVFIFQKN